MTKGQNFDFAEVPRFGAIGGEQKRLGRVKYPRSTIEGAAVFYLIQAFFVK